MPPAVAAAAITAGSALAGGALQARSSGKAAKTQQQAAQEALAYQREQDAKEEARYREQIAKEEAQWNAEQQRIAPFRQAAEALLMQNANRLGLSGVRPASQSGPMPANPPRTLSSLAGMSSSQNPDAVYGMPAVAVPQLSLSDVLQNRWTGGRNAAV